MASKDKQQQSMIMLTYISMQLISEFAENVPGFEMMNENEKVAYLKQVWNVYK